MLQFFPPGTDDSGVAAPVDAPCRARLLLVAALAAVALVGGVAGCSSPARPTAAEPVSLSMWSHGGTPAEKQALERQVQRWNSGQAESAVRLVEVPEGDYGQVAQTAITARELPDIVQVDGPLVPSYAYQGALRPLESHLDPGVVDTLLPSLLVQGTYDDRLYAVGAFESSIALYADGTRLAAAGVRIPGSADDAWTTEEFAAVLAALAEHDEDGRVLDLKLNYGIGEWLTYGFSPVLWSGGADLFDRSTGAASGTLDSPEAVAALTTVASWRPYVDPNVNDDAFITRQVALSWVGHWAYSDYAAALGDDLVLLPLPDLGHGSHNSQGSWAWALSSTGEHPDEAARVLEFLVSDHSVAETVAANGAVPGTWTGLQRDPRYREGGVLAPFATALTQTCSEDVTEPGCISVARPQTPGYPTLSNAFATAVDAVLNGRDAQAALTEAARTVDQDVQANNGYQPQSTGDR